MDPRAILPGEPLEVTRAKLTGYLQGCLELVKGDPSLAPTTMDVLLSTLTEVLRIRLCLMVARCMEERAVPRQGWLCKAKADQ
jgi:hypothetical protein